jgi:hypothetical protein
MSGIQLIGYIVISWVMFGFYLYAKNRYLLDDIYDLLSDMVWADIEAESKEEEEDYRYFFGILRAPIMIFLAPILWIKGLV